MQLKGAVAVVTGASSGIGEAVAVGLAQRGAKVVLAARRKDRLDELADRIERAGGTALAIRCDVTDREQLASLPTVVKEAFGPCDVLVNNAGVPGGGTFANLSYQQIEDIVEVNVLGVMYGTRAFLPGMLKRHHGHIVNVASLAGRFATPGAAVYGASKHAVVAFSESLFYEVEDQGVLVTAVNPGFVKTEGFPLVGMDPRMILTMDKVAGAVVRVVRDDIAPELSVPRYISPLAGIPCAHAPAVPLGDAQGPRYGPQRNGSGGRMTGVTQRIAFDGELIAGRGGGHAIRVDEATMASLGAKHMSRVAGTLNGHPFRSNVVKMGGGMLLGVHKANVEALSLTPGDTVAVVMSLDGEPRGDDVPPEILAEALRNDPAAATTWNALAPSHRREYVGYIKEAKKDETRARRVQRTIDELAGRNPTP